MSHTQVVSVGLLAAALATTAFGGDVTFKVESDWGTGFTASVNAANSSGKASTGWTLSFDLPRKITQIWNAEIVSSDGNHHVVRNVSWNGQIPAGGSVDFGFCGIPGGVTMPLANVVWSLNGGGATATLKAVDDTATTTQDNPVTITVLANDTVPAGTTAVVKSVGAPASGKTVISADAKSIVYTPDAGFFGTDSFTYAIGDNVGKTASAEVTVAVQTRQTTIPPTPTISILKDWTAGGYAVQWTKWSGTGADRWRLYENGVVAYEEKMAPADGAQQGQFRFDDTKPYGVYVYQVELSNTAGASRSESKYYAVDGASAILLGGVDNGRQALQVTLGFGVSASYVLTDLASGSPDYVVSTSNPNVIDCSVTGGVLKLTTKKSGRACVKIQDRAVAETRLLGIRVKNADGSTPGLPDYVAVGSVSEDTDGDLKFWREFGADLKNRRMDIRYIYINGGPKSQGVGWRTWSSRDGFRVTSYVRESLKLGMIPFLVYYNIPDGGESYTTDKAHIQSPDYMLGYFTDLVFALDLVKAEAGDEMVGFIMEPDFLGYLAQNDGPASSIPACVDAAYLSGALLRGKDPDFPSTAAGLVRAINATIAKRLPAAYFGWQFNLWASPAGGFTTPISGKGIVHLTDSLGVAAGRTAIRREAAAIADYYIAAGVLDGGASFVSIDKYGLDAGAEGKAADPASSTWFWNAIHWGNYLEFVKTLRQKTNRPVILWQLPVGHVNSSKASNPYVSSGTFSDLTNVSRQFEDSAPTYLLGDAFQTSGARLGFFGQRDDESKVSVSGDVVMWGRHMDLARDAGVAAALFGAGVGDSTDGIGDPPTDGFWWIVKAQEYYRAPTALSGGATNTNKPPVSAADQGTVDAGSELKLNVLANDSDPDGDVLTVVSVTSPAHGSAAVVDASTIRYTPAAGYSGADQFLYTVSDGHGGQATASVAITVTPATPPPTDSSVSLTIASDWGSGFTGAMSITYKGGATLQGWTVEFDLPCRLASVWDASLVSSTNNHHVVKNLSWNGTVASGAGASISFGFNGVPGNITAKPTNVTLNGVPVGGGTPPPPPPVLPTLSIAGGSAYEGSAAQPGGVTATVSLSVASATAVTVKYATKNGTGIAGTDFSAASGTLAFKAGETMKSVVVQLIGDQVSEPDKTFSIALSNPVGATLGTAEAACRIVDDDQVVPPPASDYKVMAYFPEWGIYQRNFQIKDVPADKLTHLFYAFANITDAGEVGVYDSYAAVEKAFPGDTWDQPLRGNFNQIRLLKAAHPHLKVLISVGGWTLSAKFSDVAATAAARTTFSASAARFAAEYGFDGVDLDWEYPVSGGNYDVKHRPDDAHNYTLLVTELRQQLDLQGLSDGKDYLITVAAPAGYSTMDNFDLTGMAAVIDWFNVMTYDYHGAWEMTANHQAPLHANLTDPSAAADKFNCDWTLWNYILRGVPAGKIMMGVPIYGRGWKGAPPANNGLFQTASGASSGTWEVGMLDYKDIRAKMAASPTVYQHHWDAAAHAAFLYCPGLDGGTFITYDDTATLSEKTQYVKDNGLGGVFFWEISADTTSDSADSLVGTAAHLLIGD